MLAKYKKLLVALAVCTSSVVAGGIVTSNMEANAYPTTKHFYHYGPDAGLDTSIIVTCDWYDKQPQTYLPEGTAEDSCNVTGVYVRSGEELWCQTTPGNFVKATGLDATGWHQGTYWCLYGYVVHAD